MLHNYDRMFGDDMMTHAKMRLSSLSLSTEEQDLVDVEHSKLNSEQDNPVTIVLKDADRLGNIGAIFFNKSRAIQT